MGAVRSRLSDESGLAERILVGIVAWAFASVACLVTILMTANHIDERVAFIRSQVSPIDHNLDTVKVLNQVNANADQISRSCPSRVHRSCPETGSQTLTSASLPPVSSGVGRSPAEARRLPSGLNTAFHTTL